MSITSNHFANLKTANLMRLKTNEAATEQITAEQIENAKKQNYIWN